MAGCGLVIAAGLALLWPGDVPFINDEPQLVANAVAASAGGRLAPMGLQGTFGFAYGPLPTWIYQGLLAVSHDLVVVAALHAALMVAVTGGALWWLGRTLGLWPAFVAVPLLSPYFWFYARAVWDNTFMLPLGALAVAGYAAFLTTRSPTGLRVTLAALVALPLVHLMSLSLVVPVALHLMTVHRRALWAHKGSVIAVAALAGWMAWPYLQYLAGPHPSSPPAVTVVDGWLFPLLGARLLGTRGLSYFFGPEPVTGAPFTWGTPVSLAAYGLAWFGIGVAIAACIRAARSRDWPPRAHLAGLAVSALALQAIIHGASAKFEHPHYQNGTWIATVLLAWFAVDWLVRRGTVTRALALVAVGALTLVNVGVVCTLAVSLHYSQGTREVYGPTLANQQQVARALAGYAAGSEIDNRVIQWDRYPHTLATLRALQTTRRLDLPRRRLRLDYVSDDPRSGGIGVFE